MFETYYTCPDHLWENASRYITFQAIGVDAFSNHSNSNPDIFIQITGMQPLPPKLKRYMHPIFSCNSRFCLDNLNKKQGIAAEPRHV